MVFTRHMRAARLCAKGGRQWCQSHGISWDEFLGHGIPASRLRALNDPFADRVVAAAEEEANGSAGR